MRCYFLIKPECINVFVRTLKEERSLTQQVKYKKLELGNNSDKKEIKI